MYNKCQLVSGMNLSCRRNEAASSVVPNTGLNRVNGAWQALQDE